MSDPFAREIGRVPDAHGRQVIVGVSYGTVTLWTQDGAVDLAPAQAEEFAQAFTRACWVAGSDAAVLHGGAADGSPGGAP